MGMRIRCPLCRKMVRDKPILGTMHFCLSPEGREARRWEIHEGHRQIEQQRRMVAEGKGRGLGHLERLEPPIPSPTPAQPE